MTLKEVQEIIRNLVEYDIEDFEYEKSGVRLHIRRSGRRTAESQASPGTLPATPSPAVVTSPIPSSLFLSSPPQPALAESVPGKPAEEPHVVRSPIVGTFYKAPNPGSPPFVKIGSRVEQGQTLCIVEAMKLMNEIEADLSGEIVEIYVENKQPVEYGQALFAIRSSATVSR